MNGENQNIFGEGDIVFNALETELTVVTQEIAAAEKSIDRLKDKIMDLEERRTELKKAIKIVKSNKTKDAPAEEEEEEANTPSQDPF